MGEETNKPEKPDGNSPAVMVGNMIEEVLKKVIPACTNAKDPKEKQKCIREAESVAEVIARKTLPLWDFLDEIEAAKYKEKPVEKPTEKPIEKPAEVK